MGSRRIRSVSPSKQAGLLATVSQNIKTAKPIPRNKDLENLMSQLFINPDYVILALHSLQRKGRDLSLADEDGNTLLHYALKAYPKNANPNAAKILTRFIKSINCDVNRKDKQGQAPVDIAQKDNNHDALHALLDQGAIFKGTQLQGYVAVLQALTPSKVGVSNHHPVDLEPSLQLQEQQIYDVLDTTLTQGYHENIAQTQEHHPSQQESQQERLQQQRDERLVRLLQAGAALELPTTLAQPDVLLSDNKELGVVNKVSGWKTSAAAYVQATTKSYLHKSILDEFTRRDSTLAKTQQQIIAIIKKINDIATTMKSQNVDFLFFGNGKLSKSCQIQEALARAKTYYQQKPRITVNEFLHASIEGKPSVYQALNKPRHGFRQTLGLHPLQTTSCKAVEAFLATLNQPAVSNNNNLQVG